MLTPVIEALREARKNVESLFNAQDHDNHAIPDMVESDDIKSFREESQSIIETYVNICMKNAVYSISEHFTDVTKVVFSVSMEKEGAYVMLESITEDGDILSHPNVDAVESMINQFASNTFSDNEIVEFFDNKVAYASGKVTNLSSEKKVSKISI